MEISCLFVVILTSLTSLPLAYLLNKWDAMKDNKLVFAVGVISLGVATVVPALYIRSLFKKVDPIIYACCCFCWSCVIDLFIGLELDGYVSGFMRFYFMEGEPYLQTAHGTMINYWDGTAHLVMYLAIIALFSQSDSYREVGLYWVGSIMNSMIVFLQGNVLGKFGVKSSYLLNIPYFLVPLLAGFKFIRERAMHIRSYQRVPSIWNRRVDLMFVVFFLFGILLAVFRGMAVMGCKTDIMQQYMVNIEPYLSDSSTYPKIQMLVYMYYFVFYYMTAVYGLLYTGQPWMSDWALIHAGASAQAQFVHITSALHHRTPKALHAPCVGASGALFWCINLSLLVFPHLFAWHCLKNTVRFGRTYTVETAEPAVRLTRTTRSKKD